MCVVQCQVYGEGTFLSRTHQLDVFLYENDIPTVKMWWNKCLRRSVMKSIYQRSVTYTLYAYTFERHKPRKRSWFTGRHASRIIAGLGIHSNARTTKHRNLFTLYIYMYTYTEFWDTTHQSGSSSNVTYKRQTFWFKFLLSSDPAPSATAKRIIYVKFTYLSSNKCTFW